LVLQRTIGLIFRRVLAPFATLFLKFLTPFGIDAAAEYYQCPDLLPIAGSQAGIQLIPNLLLSRLPPAPSHTPIRVLLPKVGYKEHQHAWRQWVANSTVHLTWYHDTPSHSQLATADVVVIINPNNPSATKLDSEQLLTIRANMKACAFLVIDEAFMDVTPESSLLPLFRTGMPDNWVIFRSLGKFFGLAGLRVGFMFASPKFLREAQDQLGPWSLTGPSRFIAKQALLNTQWQALHRTALIAMGRRLEGLLKSFFDDVNGHFLFYTVKIDNATTLFETLAKQGILVRLCDELDALRFGLPKTEYDWHRLEAALSYATDVAP
jgi:cobalamin biosynthetic protein CobC